MWIGIQLLLLSYSYLYGMTKWTRIRSDFDPLTFTKCTRHHQLYSPMVIPRVLYIRVLLWWWLMDSMLITTPRPTGALSWWPSHHRCDCSCHCHHKTCQNCFGRPLSNKLLDPLLTDKTLMMLAWYLFDCCRAVPSIVMDEVVPV